MFTHSSFKKTVLTGNVIILSLVLVLAGCTIKLISDYDEKTDIAVTQLQKSFETFFVTAGNQSKPECEYANHMEFYGESKVEISAIEMRAQAIPNNEITIKQIGLLKDSFKLLEKYHKDSCITEVQAEPLRRNFNSIFTAILKLELAKKRGEK